MILSGHTIAALGIVTPCEPRTLAHGMSYGLSVAGYDIRTRNAVDLWPGRFALSVSVERFTMPRDVLGMVTNKSTWARRGVVAPATTLEPGWRGHLTLEMVNYSTEFVAIAAGSPIAQVIFHRIDSATDGYAGKYQDQPAKVVRAILEYSE